MTFEQDQDHEPGDVYSLEHTPTWAVGAVCVVFIALSLLMQRGLQKLGTVLNLTCHFELHVAREEEQKSLNEALTKVKEELMLLGFISLLLTAAQNPISRLCMPDYWADHMLPCHFDRAAEIKYVSEDFSIQNPSKLQPTPANSLPAVASRPVESTLPMEHHHASTRRTLPEEQELYYCSPGNVPVFSTESLHQLHIFIFVMAAVHVFYSLCTMLLGFTQLRSWKKWEEETCVDNYNYTDEIKKSFNESSFKRALGRQNTFVASRASAPWSTTFTGVWINSFFRQFGRPVTKSDYLSLRLGFIKNHNAPKRLNFYKYMMRSLEDDLKTVIGISGYLWVFVIFFMVLNVHGWFTYFWMSFIPVLINVVIGTKLQHIITQLALETAHSHGICNAPVKPRDELFWFNKPDLLLYLIHFVLFQNAFELAFCVWLVTTFGFNSCFFNQHGFIISRVIVGILAQILCSYSTLPLYALVSQSWRSKARESTRRKLRLSQELHNKSGSEHKRFEHLHLHIHHESSSRHSDGSSKSSQLNGSDFDHEEMEDHNSVLAASHQDHDDHDYPTHHSVLHGHKFQVHPESPRTPRKLKTPRTPKSRSTPRTKFAPLTFTPAPGGDYELSSPTVGREGSTVRGGKRDEFESGSESPIYQGGSNTILLRLPREESIVQRDCPVSAPEALGPVERMSCLSSPAIKLTLSEDLLRAPATLEVLDSGSSSHSKQASFCINLAPILTSSDEKIPQAEAAAVAPGRGSEL